MRRFFALSLERGRVTLPHLLARHHDDAIGVADDQIARVDSDVANQHRDG